MKNCKNLWLLICYGSSIVFIFRLLLPKWYRIRWDLETILSTEKNSYTQLESIESKLSLIAMEIMKRLIMLRKIYRSLIFLVLSGTFQSFIGDRPVVVAGFTVW